MKFLCTHLILELMDVESENLNSETLIKDLLVQAAKAAKATILDVRVCKFDPQGVTGIVMLAESHISIHTWPEYKRAAIDVLTCGRVDARAAADVFIAGLGGIDSLFEMKRLRISESADVSEHTTLSVADENTHHDSLQVH